MEFQSYHLAVRNFHDFLKRNLKFYIILVPICAESNLKVSISVRIEITGSNAALICLQYILMGMKKN